MTTIAQSLASKVDARLRCLSADNISKLEWADRHQERADALVREHFPSGSGFDSGTQLDWDKSTGEKLVFKTAFHHMDEHGGYDGWTEHVVTVTASLRFSVSVKISGKNRNDIINVIGDQFHESLLREEAPAEQVTA